LLCWAILVSTSISISSFSSFFSSSSSSLCHWLLS
jgi:hypothetical protein